MNIMAMRWGKLYKGTPAELALEDAVAALGVPYRTQFPGYMFGLRYFPDFYLPTLGVVIEVDDDSHSRTEKLIADEERSSAIAASWGAQVVRCTNEEALSDPRGTVRAMLQSIGLWPVPSRLPALAESLPVPKKAAAKNRRASQKETRQAKRRARIARRSGGCRKPRGPLKRRAPLEAPTQVLTPQL